MKSFKFILFFVLLNFLLYGESPKELKEIIDKEVRFNSWKEAKLDLEIYLKSNPDDSYAYSVYASVLGELKLYDDSILAIRNAINFEKNDEKKGEYYSDLGFYYYCKDIKDLSLDMYKKSLSLNTNIASSYYMIGLINYQNSDYDAALFNWKKYVSITDNIEKKIKMQDIISKFEKQINDLKSKLENEKTLRKNY